MYDIDRGAILSYLHGEIRSHGWWYYFPVAVALKTTLPLLALGVASIFMARARPYVAAAAHRQRRIGKSIRLYRVP